MNYKEKFNLFMSKIKEIEILKKELLDENKKDLSEYLREEIK